VATTMRPRADFAPYVEAGTFYVVSQNALDRIMSDLQVAFEARFTYFDLSGAQHTDRFRLDGLNAALAEIDRRQQRIGADRRAGPPQNLPPAPEVDAQAMSVLDGVPPRLIDWHQSSSMCEAVNSPSLGPIAPVVAPLSDTAMLYALPCFIREGRPHYRLYMIESGEIGGMRALLFAAWTQRFGWTGTDTLEAIVYDPAERRLTSNSLRGVDGCGYSGEWVFDSYAFRLETMRAPEDCAAPGGDPDAWPTVFAR
jgi:hypothetical protein